MSWFNLFGCFSYPNSLKLRNNSSKLRNNSLQLENKSSKIRNNSSKLENNSSKLRNNFLILENTLLKYKVIDNKYIITYISSYDENLNDYLNSIFDKINKFYEQKHLQYSRCCGKNATFICNNLKIKGIKVGKIIINDWKNNMNEVDLETIKSTYGEYDICIGSSYHALAYLILNIEKIKYHIAIETTSNDPYKLQFYIGNSYDEFLTILKRRYQCNKIYKSFECDKYWYDICHKNSSR